MRDTIDVFYSFRSPYSYLATRDMLALAHDYDVDVHMADALSAIGLSLEDMQDAIKSDTRADDIEANQNALTAVGHWGVPTFTFREEPFFGQDRVELLRWTLDKNGIERRAN